VANSFNSAGWGVTERSLHVFRQSAVEISGEYLKLFFCDPEHRLHCLEHRFHKDHHGLVESDILQFRQHHIEQFTQRSLIFILPLEYRQDHVSHHGDGDVSCHRIVGKRIAFLLQPQVGLAGLEEDLNIPALAVDPNDLFFAEIHVRADQSDSVLAVAAVADIDQSGWDRVLIRAIVLAHKDLHRQKVTAASSALLRLLEDLLGIHAPAFEFVCDPGTLLHHCDGVEAHILDRNDLVRIREPGVEQNVFCLVASFHRCIKQFEHDIGSLAQCHGPTPPGDRSSISQLHDSKLIALLVGGQEAEIYRKEGVAVRPAKCQQAESLAVFHLCMIKHSGDHVGLLVAASAKEGVIDDEYIFAFLTGQTLHEVAGDSCGQERGEPEPVGPHTVEEPVVCVLTEILTVGIRADLHVHAPGIEDVADHITEDLHDQDTLFLAGVTLSKELSDMEDREKILDHCAKHLSIAVVLWYDSHGINPP